MRLADDVGGVVHRAALREILGGGLGHARLCMADQQVTVAFVANDEAVTFRDQRRIEFAAIAAAVHDPDAAALGCCGHRADRGQDLLVLGDEVGRFLRPQRGVERHDGIVLVLDADHLGEPVAVGDCSSRPVTHACQVLHLLRVRLCNF